MTTQASLHRALLPLAVGAFALAGCSSNAGPEPVAATESALPIDPIDPPLINCYRDADGDGYGAGTPIRTDECPPGYVTRKGDCNDSNASVHGITCYRDADGDGFPGTPVTVCATSCPAPYSATKTDCDDTNANVKPRPCQTDEDGDGYTAQHLVCTAVCPSTAGLRGGDCNDANASVHPERAESAFNQVDDDCSGATDEAEAYYTPTGFGNGATVFSIRFRLNEAVAYFAAANDALWARVYYRKLGAYDTEMVSPILKANLTVENNVPYVAVTISGLQPLTPYEARVRFYKDAAATQRTGTGAYDSDKYWTITKPSTTDALDNARASIVLKAIYENDYSNRGFVKDGTRYGASGGELWCSEFYASMTMPWLKNISPDDESNTDRMRAYFEGFYSFATGAGIVTAGLGRPGDYLWVDSDGDGVTNHSEMLLAYDAAKTQYWQVAGNCSNRVCLNAQSPNGRILGVGILQSTMLK